MIIFSHFAKIFFSEKTDFKKDDLINCLNKINWPIHSNGQQQICNAIITERVIYDALKLIESDKTPGNGGLSEEFYEVFWDDVKMSVLASLNDAFIKKELLPLKNNCQWN